MSIPLQGVLSCDVHHLICSEQPGRCREVNYNGETDCIFFLNKWFGVAEEVLWDFIALSMSSKVTLTGYCSEMSRRFQTTNSLSVGFLGRTTFNKVFFTWIAKMNLDFRQFIDPWCGYDPPVLACDGTHLGVSFKNLKLEKPVTEPDLVGQKVKPVHKRADRLLLSDQEARGFLHFLCLKLLCQSEEGSSEFSGSNLAGSVQNLLTCVENLGKSSVSDMVSRIMRKDTDMSVLLPATKILKHLTCSGKAALVSVFPFRFHSVLEEACQQYLQGEATTLTQAKLKEFLPEAADLLEAATKINLTQLAAGFLLDLVELTKAVHLQDRPTPSPEPIPGTYDPRQGCAYYFHPHGCQVRQLPEYDVDDKKKEGPNECSKFYPSVSFSGFGHLFLMFCPEHGHCYGFHLIKGGEGRKDVFWPILKYKESPPAEFFYDNACQASEFTLNREPSFWRMVRFWHDIFHSFNHKDCGILFQSVRVQGHLRKMNSEICEQFNAYIQNVKYTACKMLQDHFMMYMQFMVYLWNERKTKNYKKMLSVAFAGQKTD